MGKCVLGFLTIAFLHFPEGVAQGIEPAEILKPELASGSSKNHQHISSMCEFSMGLAYIGHRNYKRIHPDNTFAPNLGVALSLGVMPGNLLRCALHAVYSAERKVYDYPGYGKVINSQFYQSYTLEMGINLSRDLTDVVPYLSAYYGIERGGFLLKAKDSSLNDMIGNKRIQSSILMGLGLGVQCPLAEDHVIDMQLIMGFPDIIGVGENTPNTRKIQILSPYRARINYAWLF
jgi:hypothetical protein